MYQISIIAAFFAGMVALFAPCCISYLLPAYLGNIFKEKKQVFLMTLVYSLGIFVVMIPVVLGAKVLSSFFFRLHDTTYLVGGILMLVVAVVSFFGVKLPMPHFAIKQKKSGPDVVSTFSLGLISGITSACCAPVLIGVIALSSLTPTTLQSLGVGFSYVLGMVSPLYIASALIEKGNILGTPFLKKKISTVKLRNRKYPIFVSNILAAAIFFVTGILMLVLTKLGMLGMPTGESSVTRLINEVAINITNRLGGSDWKDLLFLFVILYLLYRYAYKAVGKRKPVESNSFYTCPMHKEIAKKERDNCPKCGMALVRKDRSGSD